MAETYQAAADRWPCLVGVSLQDACSDDAERHRARRLVACRLGQRVEGGDDRLQLVQDVPVAAPVVANPVGVLAGRLLDVRMLVLAEPAPADLRVADRHRSPFAEDVLQLDAEEGQRVAGVLGPRGLPLVPVMVSRGIGARDARRPVRVCLIKPLHGETVELVAPTLWSTGALANPVGSCPAGVAAVLGVSVHRGHRVAAVRAGLQLGIGEDFEFVERPHEPPGAAGGLRLCVQVTPEPLAELPIAPVEEDYAIWPTWPVEASTAYDSGDRRPTLWL